MLRRLFVKEAFEHIEKELISVYQQLGIEESTLKIKKQPATYSKPYSYIVEGTIRMHRFVLSLQHAPLKDQEQKQQLELIIQCENPHWRTLLLQKKNQTKAKGKKILGLETIRQLKNVNLDKLMLESNDKEWTEVLFDVGLGQKASILDEIKFSSFILERKRLYAQVSWLPDNFSKRQALTQLLDFSISLVEKVDQQA